MDATFLHRQRAPSRAASLDSWVAAAQRRRGVPKWTPLPEGAAVQVELRHGHYAVMRNTPSAYRAALQKANGYAPAVVHYR
jgi:hypothetical protein